MKNNASNVNTLKNNNRALILNEIRKRPLSRTELSRITKLTKPAVTMITNRLIEEGQLREMGTAVSSKGRKPILLDIIPDRKFAVGVELHRTRVEVVIANLKSEIVDHVIEHPDSFPDRTSQMAWICSSIHGLTERNGIPFSKLIGIGISSPGPLNYRTGVILNPPNFDRFHNAPVVKMLQKEFELPVMLENNSVLLAMTEYFKKDMKNFRNSMFIIIENGIGTCTVMDGQVYRGCAGFAGELGHTTLDIHGPKCSCGNYGCLELYITLSSLKKRFEFESYEDIVNAAYRNDPFAVSVIDYLAFRLASAFITAGNMLDLDSIFVYGEYNFRPDLLISKLNSLIKERSVITKAHEITVFASKMDKRTAAASSTAAIINSYFKQEI